MCRITGYIGEAIPLSGLLVNPPHSLRQQAKAPRELSPGVIGSDGFGVGWFADGMSTPARYRSILPIWVDDNVDDIAEHVRSPVIVASSRTASERMPLAIPNTPPFRAGAALLVHNGEIARFQDTVLEPLRGALSPAARARVLGNTDTEYMAALLGDRHEPTLLARVLGLLGVVQGCVRSAQTWAQLNLIAAHGDEMVIVRHALGAEPPSLYARPGPRGLSAASEPMDDSREWKSLQPGDVIHVRRGSGAPSVAWSRLPVV
jgi:glutamine amidotransferase